MGKRKNSNKNQKNESKYSISKSNSAGEWEQFHQETKQAFEQLSTDNLIDKLNERGGTNLIESKDEYTELVEHKDEHTETAEHEDEHTETVEPNGTTIQSSQQLFQTEDTEEVQPMISILTRLKSKFQIFIHSFNSLRLVFL